MRLSLGQCNGALICPSIGLSVRPFLQKGFVNRQPGSSNGVMRPCEKSKIAWCIIAYRKIVAREEP